MQTSACVWIYCWTKKRWKIRTRPLGHYGARGSRRPWAEGRGAFRPSRATGLFLAKPFSFTDLSATRADATTKEDKDLYTNALSVPLCGAEHWRVTQRDSQRLRGFHTSCLRKICWIYWPQKITSKDLYQRTGQWDITTVVMQRRWRWLGHVIRKDRESITQNCIN